MTVQWLRFKVLGFSVQRVYGVFRVFRGFRGVGF